MNQELLTVWKAMTDETPPKNGPYLVTVFEWGDRVLVDTDYWDELGEFWEVYGIRVVAWAELPKPYGGVK